MSDNNEINGHPDLGIETKVCMVSPTKYRPVEMTDSSVYDLAKHYFTFTEICEHFRVAPATFELHHGEAFRAGKANAMQKPRILLNQILEDFTNLPPGSFARSDIPVGNLLKAIELHAKKYEGLGSRQTIVHEGLKYDGVESVPDIIERPETTE